MWHTIVAIVAGGNVKHVKVDEAGRIIGRIVEREGEFAASKVVVDEQGIGHSKSRGCYITLEQAKTAVETVLPLAGEAGD